jgi:ParB family chromosome partitioning protein
MRRRGGLGRGLDALIPSAAKPDGEQATTRDGGAAVDAGTQPSVNRMTVAGATLIDVPLDRVDPNPRQPREAFDEDALAELAASIAAVGVLQPIVVRPNEGRFQVIMGERRVRAAKLVDLTTIPAVVRLTEEDSLLRDALIENIHREDLNPLEEAAAYESLLRDFEVTHEELAIRIGRSRSGITNALRLLKAAPSVQRRIAAGILSAGHARAVMKFTDHDQQERLADRIVAEGLTVRQAEELASHLSGEAGPADPEAERRSRSRAVPQAPGVAELADRLSDRFDTRVRVQIGKRKGKVLIEFATLDDLQRICDVIGLNAPMADDVQRPSIGSDTGEPSISRSTEPGLRAVSSEEADVVVPSAAGLSAPPR